MYIYIRMYMAMPPFFQYTHVSVYVHVEKERIVSTGYTHVSIQGLSSARETHMKQVHTLIIRV